MPFNLLFLPLVGGYLFLVNFRLTKLKSERFQGHRLIIESALYGILFLILSSIITYYGTRKYPQISNLWNRFIPFEYSGTAFLSFIIGYILPKIMNPFITEDHFQSEREKIIRDRADPLEMLLHKALSEKKHVSLTLKNHKVYVGRITSLFNPATPLTNIKIVPTFSGYRDQATKQLFLPVSYQKVYEKIIAEKNLLETNMEDFEIVIPVSEILSANIFDIRTYDEYFKE